MNNAMTYQTPETMVRIVEERSFMNPIKTRRSEFLKIFPGAKLDIDNVLKLCPVNVGIIKGCPVGSGRALKGCSACREEVWSTIIE